MIGTQRPPRYWAVVPAAGVGARMGGDIPKQYLPLAGRTVIEHTLERLCSHPAVAAVVVALSASDTHFDRLNIACSRPLHRAPGGAERCHSVLNALDVLEGHAADDDWVLVHDAARPCVRRDDIQRLMDTVAGHAVGGLLAVPVRDTMKRSDAGGVVTETVPREHLWHALTPQMFRFGELRAALRAALADGALVTDEAAAMERLGRMPVLVEGHGDNIKITRPEDLSLAAFHLQQQEAHG